MKINNHVTVVNNPVEKSVSQALGEFSFLLTREHSVQIMSISSLARSTKHCRGIGYRHENKGASEVVWINDIISCSLEVVRSCNQMVDDCHPIEFIAMNRTNTSYDWSGRSPMYDVDIDAHLSAEGI